MSVPNPVSRSSAAAGPISSQPPPPTPAQPAVVRDEAPLRIADHVLDLCRRRRHQQNRPQQEQQQEQEQEGRQYVEPSPATATAAKRNTTTMYSREDDVYASVSDLLAAEPGTAPVDAWDRLFGQRQQSHGGAAKQPRRDPRDVVGRGVLPVEEARRARLCGDWSGSAEEPGDLFLRVYHDSLCMLNDDLGSGMVSPCLMGSSGVLPLTIFSVIPDIARHMANMIVRAEHEVFLATNYWQNSEASAYLTGALKELSRRVGLRSSDGRGRRRVTVKVLYDRGTARQAVTPHCAVQEREWTGPAVALPRADEVPGLDLEVVNYHRPLVGTFHAKFIVVDRRVAMLQSNNIQDNDNVEMAVRLEGDIVDAVYDMALLSWHRALEPPLPCLADPAAGQPITCFSDSFRSLFHGRADAEAASEPLAKKRDSKMSASGDAAASPPAQEPRWDVAGSPSPSNLPEFKPSDPHYDVDIAGEVRRVQASVSGADGETRRQAITRHLNHTVNAGYTPGDDGDGAALRRRRATGGTTNEEDEDGELMTPYLPHAPHAPFPMALVCRPPRGSPVADARSVATPQNAAWLSALRCARESVVIQSPTLNAGPVVAAVREACERGVDVWCYICLGYNDAGELLPLQGGHNEGVAASLHAALSAEGRRRLHWHWYVARDCGAPVAATRKRRSCHVKLLIADERVAVVGSGNQDTQSWMHSQEANVLLDLPPAVARDWAAALHRTGQNTRARGAVDPRDGIWRDAGTGRQVPGAMGVDAGRFAWAKGIVGAVKRVKGTGGF